MNYTEFNPLLERKQMLETIKMTSCGQKCIYGRKWILNFEGMCTMFDSLYSQQNFTSTASLVDSNVKQGKANIISTFAHTVDHN